MRLAYAYPAVRSMNAAIPPGLWQVTQLAVKIGWICVANETAAAAVTLIDNSLVAVAAGDAESVTLTVKPEFATAVWVPLITPAALRLNPAGRAPAETFQL